MWFLLQATHNLCVSAFILFDDQFSSFRVYYRNFLRSSIVNCSVKAFSWIRNVDFSWWPLACRKNKKRIDESILSNKVKIIRISCHIDGFFHSHVTQIFFWKRTHALQIGCLWQTDVFALSQFPDFFVHLLLSWYFFWLFIMLATRDLIHK